MLVDDNPVPYPRQYLAPQDAHLVNHAFAGWMVPFAGAPAYFVWWYEVEVHTLGDPAGYPTEANLQERGCTATPYRFPNFISLAVLEHAKGNTC